jgi:hypothetical protein
VKRRGAERVSRWTWIEAGYMPWGAWGRIRRPVKLTWRMVFLYCAVMTGAVLVIKLGQPTPSATINQWGMYDAFFVASMLVFIPVMAWNMRTAEFRRWRLLAKRRGMMSWRSRDDSGDMLESRRKNWMTMLGQRKLIASSHPNTYYWTGTFGLTVVFLFAVSKFDKSLGSAAILIYPIMFGMLLVGVIMSRRLRKESLARLKTWCCLDCGHGLEGLHGRLLPTAAGATVATGPERCPECGCAWPMVPPMLPKNQG